MTPPPVRWVQSGPGRIAFVIWVAAYAYWATGLRPFTLSSYVAVGIPVAVVGSMVAVAGRGRAGGPRPPSAEAVGLRWVLPWLLVALIAAGLEGLGLALGGRSTAVPTLSTVIDHVLAWRALRLVLFCGWLLIGSIPVIRTVRGHSRVR
jgi:hypothetical protein